MLSGTLCLSMLWASTTHMAMPRRSPLPMARKSQQSTCSVFTRREQLFLLEFHMQGSIGDNLEHIFTWEVADAEPCMTQDLNALHTCHLSAWGSAANHKNSL